MDLTYIGDVLFTLGAVLCLVLLNGFFVASEFALVKIRDTQLVTLARAGNRRARVARKVIANLDAALSATQLGITLASLGLGWYAEPAFKRLLELPLESLGVESAEIRHSIAFFIGFSSISFFHIVFGELAPKSIAIQRPLPTSLWVAGPMVFFERISFPAIWALNGTSLWLLRQVGIAPVAGAELGHSEEDLRLLVSGGSKGGEAAPLGRNIVLNAFDLRRRVVREVMRPRREIVFLGTDLTIEQCIEVAERTRYSRFPLCEGEDIDRTLGVLHIKDLYAARGRARTGADLKGLTRRIICVPESCRLQTLLGLFLERKLHFGVVVDEYGGTLGMVTLENILEALVGQIQDEFDQEKPLIQPLAPGEWDVDGALGLHELSELVGVPIDGGEVSTVSGYVIERLGGFAQVGDLVEVGDSQLAVLELDGLRVQRLRLVKRLETTRFER